MLNITNNAREFFTKSETDGFWLYGAGVRGESVGRAILRNEADFHGYIDQNAGLSEWKLIGKPIIHTEELMSPPPCDTGSTWNVFVTVEDWKSAIDTLTRFAFACVQVNVLFCLRLLDFNYALGYFRYRRLKCHEFTIFCNDCTDSHLYKYLGCEMNSPTVNMLIEPGDYVKLCANLDKYMEAPFEFSHCEWSPYANDTNVVAKIADLRIRCRHYVNFEHARADWERRKMRILKDKIIFLLSASDLQPMLTPTAQEIKEFLKLPHKNKFLAMKNNFTLVPPAIAGETNGILNSRERIIEDWFDITDWMNTILSD